MAQVLALSASLRALTPEDVLRRFVVTGCALALILAENFLPL